MIILDKYFIQDSLDCNSWLKWLLKNSVLLIKFQSLKCKQFLFNFKKERNIPHPPAKPLCKYSYKVNPLGSHYVHPGALCYISDLWYNKKTQQKADLWVPQSENVSSGEYACEHRITPSQHCKHTERSVNLNVHQMGEYEALIWDPAAP